ncbi:sperm-specific sodium:proton exchanger-like isoform X2 [Lissotriton helveticus]
MSVLMKICVSPLFGFAMSLLTKLWLSHVLHDELSEVTISLTVVHLTFYLAEWGGMSGVIATIILGITLDVANFNPGTYAFFRRFWDLLSYLCIVMIFSLIGYQLAEEAIKFLDATVIFSIFTLYIAIVAIRIIMISMLSMWLKRLGRGFTWRTAVVLVWGEMRGNFTLTMALLISKSDILEEPLMKKRLLVIVSGATMLNVLINAASMRKLILLLGFCDVSPAKRMAMYSIIQRLQYCALTTLWMLKMDRFLADANWNMVEISAFIADPYYTSESNATLEELFPELVTSECPECQKNAPVEPNPSEIADMIDEARLRMLKAQLMSFWKQYNTGMLNRETTRILVNATENYVEKKGKFMNIHEVKKCWETKGVFVFLRKKIQTLVYRVKEEIIRPSPIKALKICYKIVCTNEFEFIIYLSILMNTFPVALYFIPREKHIYGYELQAMNYFFMAFYSAEACIKILALRKYYFVNRWNQFDFFILLLGLAEIAVAWILEQHKISIGHMLATIIEILRFLRLLRVLRLIKILLPRLLMMLNKQINKQLSFGFDIAKGFVVSEEDVKKVVDQLSDNTKITQKLKNVVEKDRQDGMQELGFLQRDNPAIVTAAKTSQAIRTVLNNIQDTLQGLREGGIVDQLLGAKIDVILQLKMRKLMMFPTTIPTPTAEELLRNVPWLANSKMQLHFIKSKAKILFFDYGDMICNERQDPRGVHLMVSGLVKLYGSNPRFGHDKDKEDEEAYSADTTVKIPFTDYRGIGTILCEVNCLTKHEMEFSIACETAVQTCFIGINELFEAFDAFLEYPSLEYKIWLAVATRTALNTFKEHPAYQNWTSTKMYSWLANAYIEDIDINMKFSVYDDTMEDVVLVYGSLQNVDRQESYYAPCIVPKNCQQVQGTANTTKLLIVPSTSNVIKASASDKLNDCASALCLQHAAARRRARSARTSISISVSDSMTVLKNKESVLVARRISGEIGAEDG